MKALGIDYSSGAPLPAPALTELTAALRASGKPKAPSQTFALPAGLPPARLDKAGWAIVWPGGASEALNDALEPLLALRKREADGRFAELHWKASDTSARAWLKAHYAGVVVDPRKVP